MIKLDFSENSFLRRYVENIDFQMTIILGKLSGGHDVQLSDLHHLLDASLSNDDFFILGSPDIDTSADAEELVENSMKEWKESENDIY